ncbi:hypothetical protein O181_080686 [Austropuccinia psidii MF-1]|uniref:Integrase catalytic domain-containing protein n=1 Tax=Austropuccinia psidii MF-1 TaxID=1389203 RepID=A0A9Q3IF69_9BASI|nr:hypothetical protein [Austropuccinia psidii MF-1]
MIQIQEPISPWEIAHINCLTALHPGGDRSCNAFLVLADRVISNLGLFQNIVSDRDLEFNSALLRNIHNLFGTKVSLLTAYNPQADDLSERMIQILEEMIKRLCAYGLEFKYLDGLTYYRCTLIPALELEYDK